MARIKNNSFVGSPQFDVDIDSPTFNRTIENAIGDTAKVYDQLTGKNSETDTIIHDGAGRGAALGIPLLNHYVGAKIFYEGAGGKDGGGGQTWLYSCPIFIPNSETDLVVDVLADADFDYQDVPVVVSVRSPTDYDTTACAIATLEAQTTDAFQLEASTVLYRARLRGITPGSWLFFIEMDTSTIDDDSVSFRLHSVSVHRNKRSRTQQGVRLHQDGEAQVATPSATQAVAHVDFDESLIGSLNDPINGYLTSYLDLNQNGLVEFASGKPAGGNNSYTQEDHDAAGVADDVDPARSRFHAHARSPFAGTPALPDEPEVQFPLHAEGFGPFRQDGGFAVEVAVPPTFGLLRWYPPWPTDDAALTVWRCPLMVPDFSPDKATAAKNTSALKWAVLCGTDRTSAATSWSVAAGVEGSLPSPVALSAVTNAPAGAGSEKLFYATGSGITFTGDQVQTFVVTTQRAGGNPVNTDELVVLGVCFWFDPT